MLYDDIANLKHYKGFSRGIDCLIRWLESHSLSELQDGRNKIDGGRVFANVMEAECRRPEDARFEVHQRYMDLQMDLEGAENFAVAHELKNPTPFDEAGDIGFGEGTAVCGGRLGDGMFVLFLAKEPHMPTLQAEGCTRVKKVVFKILCDEYFD